VPGLVCCARAVNFFAVSTVQEIKSAVQKLTPEELRHVHEWLENFLEDRLEFTDTFKTELEEAERQLSEGVRSRVRQP
jgi:hypothetical protein